MNQSMGIEKIRFCREASNALRPAAGAAGSAGWSASTPAALARITRCCGQMTIHTLAAMVMPKIMPMKIDAPSARSKKSL